MDDLDTILDVEAGLAAILHSPTTQPRTHAEKQNLTPWSRLRIRSAHKSA
ncbi:hypothetical protein ACFQX6_65990 [Streptosporangium lutulentum]